MFTSSQSATTPTAASASFVCNGCAALLHVCAPDNTPARSASTSLPCLTLIWTQDVLSTHVSSWSGGTHSCAPSLRGFPANAAGSGAAQPYWKLCGFFFPPSFKDKKECICELAPLLTTSHPGSISVKWSKAIVTAKPASFSSRRAHADTATRRASWNSPAHAVAVRKANRGHKLWMKLNLVWPARNRAAGLPKHLLAVALGSFQCCIFQLWLFGAVFLALSAGSALPQTLWNLQTHLSFQYR